jgi:hypothetical protein
MQYIDKINRKTKYNAKIELKWWIFFVGTDCKSALSGEKTGAYLVSFATVNWIDWKYSSARNYGNNDQTILEIDLN